MNFFIQTDMNGFPVTEDGFVCYHQVKFLNEFRGESHEILLSHKNFYRPDFCPVGTVEFVHGIIGERESVFTKREIYNRDVQFSPFQTNSGKLFVKSTFPKRDVFPGQSVYIGSDFPKIGDYFYSEVIENITHEVRFFVLNRMVVGYRFYQGEPFEFDGYTNCYVKEIISSLQLNRHESCSFDIMFDEKRFPYLIEIHNFYSCGLYGFNDQAVPIMLWRAFKKLTSSKGDSK